MKHNIRINGQIQTLECELGSGIFDKNGREIFEGDKVRYDDGDVDTIIFGDGQFYLNEHDDLAADWNGEFEIID